MESRRRDRLFEREESLKSQHTNMHAAFQLAPSCIIKHSDHQDKTRGYQEKDRSCSLSYSTDILVKDSADYLLLVILQILSHSKLAVGNEI